MLFAHLGGYIELHLQNLLLTIICAISVPGGCAVGTAVENILVHTALGVPRGNLIKKYTNSKEITVQVVEPKIKHSDSFPYRVSKRSPSPPLVKSLQRLSTKNVTVLADKISKQKQYPRKRDPPQNKRFCSLFHVSANRSETFYDHISSWAHQIRIGNKWQTPRTVTCSKTFESHGHLQRHLNSAAHQNVFFKLKNKSFFEIGVSSYWFRKKGIKQEQIQLKTNKKECSQIG